MSNDSLRQRVLSTTNLLLDAVNQLENSSRDGASSTPNGSCSNVPVESLTRPSTSTAARLPANACRASVDNRPFSSTQSTDSVDTELSHLFSWNSRLGKRSKSRPTRIGGSRSVDTSKKKKLKTWTHTFICLSKVSHKWIPDASERTSLKLAGLGEKRLSVFAYGTSSELQDDLFREFPKLSSGGGYEFLRAPETGSRELVVIEMPHDGYSVEYLQAVVKSAKIYIRPLQRDLDMRPLTKEVCCGIKIVDGLACVACTMM